ncbi:hypothetical protein BFC19_07580 [Brochothrix thermosphacta]|uniref:hypothetical protein n=1 Tax=Brochothrix thermosphacta TaxID=2756 RepID=UPI000E766C73|nr:hypothetical protein [Brochothrix thermosphacta]ANZ95248.1 hypothetical protein BFC19_07580 [Brochothrix thermosphacta]
MNLQGLITLDEQITEVKMTKEKYVFLEGPSDIIFWKSLLNGSDDSFNLIDISKVDNDERSNKRAVVSLVSKLNMEKHESFGIVDVDYDCFLSRNASRDSNKIENIYYYEGNSLESLLLHSSKFAKVIELICTNISEDNIEEFRNRVVNISRIKGKIRLINDKNIIGRQLACDKLKIKKCINKLQKAEQEILVVKSLQGSWGLSQKDMDIILEKMSCYDSIEADRYLCHGHDLFQALEALIASGVATTQKKEKYTENQLFKYFIPYFDGFSENKTVPDDLIGDILIDEIPNIYIA